MEKEVSLVLSPACKNYRKVAQKAWGLTNEQMKGMHVHHFPPVSEGGRNIPEHLYICSPEMHANGWHNGEYFIEQAQIGGKKGGKKGNDMLPREARVKGGLKTGLRSHEKKTGLFAPGAATSETCAKGGRKGGKTPWWTKGGKDVRSWECPGEGWVPGRSFTSEMGSLPYWNNGKENRRSECCPGEGWARGTAEIWWTNGKTDKKAIECPGEGWTQGRSNLSANMQRWMCTVTGRISTAGPLTIYQRSQGIDTSNRVKVSQ